MNIRRPLHSEMEELLVATDEASGFSAVLAVHSTLLGPALCATRYYPYPDEQSALQDATRSAPQTTRRCALANIPFGGACATIRVRNGRQSALDAFRRFGELIEGFEGQVIAMEDIGCRRAYMDALKETTPFACGSSQEGPGDPAYFTALGVFRGLEAAVHHQWNTDSLDGLTIAIMGVGHVGYYLCEMLHHAGVKLIVADITPANLEVAREEFNVEVVRPRQITDVACDILSPCSMGLLLDDQSIPRLKCKVVAGAANNQLVRPNRHARMLHERGIDYCPDFAINVGGLYAHACELNSYPASHATILANGVYDTTMRILKQSAALGLPAQDVAMKMVNTKLHQARKARIMQFV